MNEDELPIDEHGQLVQIALAAEELVRALRKGPDIIKEQRTCERWNDVELVLMNAGYLPEFSENF